MNRLRTLFYILTMPLPWPIRRRLLNGLLNWKVDRTASIGWSLVGARFVEMGPNSKISHFSVIRNIDELRLGEYSKIGTFNWVFGMPKAFPGHFEGERDRLPALVIGRHSSITSRHIIDATNLIQLGEYSVVAGFRSQIISHGINISKTDKNLRQLRSVTTL